MEFKIDKVTNNDIEVLLLNGYLDAHTSPDLEEVFKNLLKESKYKIAVNFKDLLYISSAGLGVFMAFIEEIRNNAGDIKFCCMSPKIFNVFDLLGFPLLYEIYTTEEETIAKFNVNQNN
jgi:anti-sigma B factor antagonist